MAIGQTTIDVAWCEGVDNVAVCGYNLYYSDGTLIADVGLSLGYTVTGLSEGTEYCFYYTAYDCDNNESEPSNIVCATTTAALVDFIFEYTTTAINQEIALNSATFTGSIDWGDSTGLESYTATTQALNHTYATASAHTVTISGDYDIFAFTGATTASRMTDIIQWGDTNADSIVLKWASGLTTLTATDQPVFNAGWDATSMFELATNFNEDIGFWDVSNIVNMQNMFDTASSFNQNIDSWITTNVTDMSHMFDTATAFNSPLNSWNVGNVTDFLSIFRDATSFNQPLNNWDVTSGVQTGAFFLGANSFNQNINDWDVSNWVVGSFVFSNTSFNQPLSGWSTGNITNMNSMFEGNTSFNQDISMWNTSGATDFERTFSGASSFNQDLGAWDVSSVLDADRFLSGATTLSAENYDSLLIGWAGQSVQSGVLLNVSAQYHFSASTARDTTLIGSNGWTIFDEGCIDCNAPIFNNPITSSAVTETTITIDWLAATVGGAPIDYYELYIDTVLDGTVNDGSPLTYTFSGLTGGIEYDIYIIVYDTNTQTNQSATVQFTTSASTLENFTFEYTTTAPSQDLVLASSSFNGTIYYGDGNSDTYTGTTQAISHTYTGGASAYTVTIDGELDTFRVTTTPSRVTDISRWGNISATTISFYQNTGLTTLSATDTPQFASGSTAYQMFYGCTNLNSDLVDWDMTNVSSFQEMFFGATLFNGELSGWTTPNVTTMFRMFQGAYAFNKSINDWDTSSVTTMYEMFASGGGGGDGYPLYMAFNQPLNNWDTSSLTLTTRMFIACSSFDQSIGDWVVSGVTDATQMFWRSGLSATNYDALLQGWSGQSLQSDIKFYSNAAHSSTSYNAHTALTETYGWEISDSGCTDCTPLHPLMSNIEAYFKFDETSGLSILEEVSNLSGSVNGGTMTNDGIINYGVTLSATSAQGAKVFGPSTRLNTWIEYNEPFSVQGWYNFDVVGGNDIKLWSNNTIGGIERGFWMGVASGDSKMYFNLSNDASGGQKIEITDYDIPLSATSTWYHVVLTYDGSTNASGVSVYVNDVETTGTIVTDTLASTSVSTSQFLIGSSVDFNEQIMSGTTDEFAVWSRELTTADVTSLYGLGAGYQYPYSVKLDAPTLVHVSATTSSVTNSWAAVTDATSYEYEYKANSGSTFSAYTDTTSPVTVTGLTISTIYDFRARALASGFSTSDWSTTLSASTGGSLLDNIEAYWKFDETSGTTFFDSANSNDLTLNQGTFTGGTINGGYGMVDLTGSGGLDTNSFNWDWDQPVSFNLWIKFKTPGGWIFSNNAVTTERGHEAWIGGDDKFRFYINSTASNSARVITTSAVSNLTTQWNMVTFTYDGGSDVSGMNIYVNNASVGLTTVTNALFSGSTVAAVNFRVNDKANSGNEGSPGSYDEFGIWNKELSTDEINELWNSGTGVQYPFT